MIITANTRLARVFRQAHDRQQIDRGLSVWTAPDILPLDAYMERCWRSWLVSTNASKPVQLLSRAQECAVWEGIISRSDAGDTLLQVAPTAEAALDAWILMHEWDVPFDAGDWNDNRDTEAFHEWAAEFRRICEIRNVLSGAQLAEFVAAKLISGEIPVPAHVQLAGFTELSPMQKRLFEAMRRKNANVEVCGTSNASNSRSARIGFADSFDEIRAAAQWSRKWIEVAAESKTPEPAIGIVVPELSKYRSTIERLFAEELHPGGRMFPERDSQRAFNISLGPALSDYPLIQTAFLVLRIDPEAIAFNDVASLLRSPFIAGVSSESGQLAQIEVRLRHLREPEISLSDVAEQAPEGLKSVLDRWQRQFAKLPPRQLPSDWAAAFSTVLKAAGWPGQRPLNSAEFQTTAAWNELLAEFSGLDSATGVLTLAAAISTLQRLAGGRQFQPESEPAPIQILGVLEASGMAFDRLWILGMHDAVWPRSTGPSPFLPLRLQRLHRVPQSSAQLNLEFSKVLTSQLLESSADVVVSYPKKESDTDLRPSPLFSKLPESSVEELTLPSFPGHAKLLFDLKNDLVETVADIAPPWSGAKSRGGSAIFQQQAACPFQAFAKLRLGADRLETSTPGLSPLDRGNLVHDVLDRVWKELGSHETLISEDAAYVSAVVRDEIDWCIEKMALTKRALRRPRFAAIEQARLERLVSEWLELEKLRQPFIVLHQEEPRQVNVGGIDLSIRADRIDRLDDKTHVIIDYKTSKHGPAEWDGPRPDEPQLPLYAIASESPLSGLIFGVAKLGELKLAGLTSADGIAPNVKAESGDRALSNRIQGWRAVLGQLAADFRNGNAAVDPKNANQTCRNCGLEQLCRIHEWNSLANDLEEDEVEEAAADD